MRNRDQLVGGGEREGLSKAAFVRGSLPAFPSLCARGGETEGAFWRDARRLVHLDPAAKALPLRGGKARPPFSLPVERAGEVSRGSGDRGVRAIGRKSERASRTALSCPPTTITD